MQAAPVSRNTTLLDALLPQRGILIDVALVLGFAIFTAVFAQIAIRFPGTTVPITGQTFAVLLTGGALGSNRGALSMALYMLMGLFIPVFAPSSSLLNEEIIHFILPWAGSSGGVWELSSGGYIVGFILGAYLVGLLAERGWDRRSSVSLAMLVGNVSIYVIGLPWLAWYIASGTTIPGLELTYYDAIVGNNVVDKTLKGGLYPFIGGDALKLLLASMALPGAWAIIGKIKGES